MEKQEQKNRGFLPSLILVMILVVLIGIAFLPSVMYKTEAAANTHEIDPEAMRVLGCCKAYTSANDFSTVMNGQVKARVLGVPYTQKVHGARQVGGGDFTEVAESVSAFVKAAIKRECKDGVLYVSRGTYKNKKFSYSAPKELCREDYISGYGQPFTGIVKYDLENSIVSARKVSDNTFTFVLDPARATRYSRNEVKTSLGGKSYPNYSHVEFTLTVDSDRPIKVVCKESFRLDKFGGTDCTAEYTEVFR